MCNKPRRCVLSYHHNAASRKARHQKSSYHFTKNNKQPFQWIEVISGPDEVFYNGLVVTLLHDYMPNKSHGVEYDHTNSKFTKYCVTVWKNTCESGWVRLKIFFQSAHMSCFDRLYMSQPYLHPFRLHCSEHAVCMAVSILFYTAWFKTCRDYKKGWSVRAAKIGFI